MFKIQTVNFPIQPKINILTQTQLRGSVLLLKTSNCPLLPVCMLHSDNRSVISGPCEAADVSDVWVVMEIWMFARTYSHIRIASGTGHQNG